MKKKKWLTLAAVLLTALLCAATLWMPSGAPVVFPQDRFFVPQGWMDEEGCPGMLQAGDMVTLQPD